MALTACVWGLFFWILYVLSLEDYLLFHIIAELVSVIIAVTIFLFVSNTRNYLKNSFFEILGTALLFVGILDFIHTLAYKGMGILNMPSPQEATQLWIAARYLHAGAFLVAPLFLNRKLKLYVAFGAFGLITSVILLSIFTFDLFPACYIEGIGLTPFKIISEYIIAGLFFCAIVIIFVNRKQFDAKVKWYLIASLGVTILSELAFTDYVSVYGPMNILGHFLKIAAFYCIYKAIIEIGLRKPYDLLLRDLKMSERHQKQLVSDLSQRNAEIQSVNRELDNFVHIASHDLRSPIRAINGYTNILRDSYTDELDDEGRFIISKILNTTAHMNELIENLLVLSRVSTVQNKLEPVEMGEILQSIVDLVYCDIQENKVDLHIQKDLPTIYTDKIKIKELFLNLITNAIKFSKGLDRTPRIDVGYQSKNDSHIFYVRDNGIGIEEQYQQKIFECFSRLHTQSEYPGTGIGLHIVKVIVESQNGTVWLESQPGKGTTFYISLPKNVQSETGQDVT